MKKTIQKGFALLLLLGSMQGYSQETPNSNKALLYARFQLMKGYKDYNPQAALATYQQLATEGNAEAMNGLGLIYSQGLGVEPNETLALDWFAKAGLAGYPKAFFNLGLLYKNGVGSTKDLPKALDYFQKAAQNGYKEAYYSWAMMHKKGSGTKQNETLAFEIFKEGADKGIGNCLYAQGYMHYKGLGTKQDYAAAIVLFEKGIEKNNAGAMYMLGLCYRNGYGIEKEETKGLYWLQKAAALDYKPAEIELSEAQPENATPNQTKTESTPIAEVENAPIEIPKKIKKVKHNITKDDISGLYTGHMLRYDWSGQNVISQTPITLNLDQEDVNLTGIWAEKDGDSIAFTAELKEKMIAFKNSKIDRVEHFYKDSPKQYAFRNAKLQVIETTEDVYIVGNLQLYDTKEEENEKPMYLILKRHIEESIINPTQAIVSKMVVFPNPIPSNSFKLSFDLQEQTPIAIKIYDLSGLLKHEQNLATNGTGLQEQMIDFKAPTGNYILNLYYNDQVLRTILIKK